MKSDLIIYTLLLYFLVLIPCSFSDSFQKKKIPLKFLRLLNELTDTSDTSDEYVDPNDPQTNSTFPVSRHKSSSGLSAGAIVGIVIPCVLVVVGVGVAAAFIGSSAPAAAAGGATAVVNPNVDLTTAGINNAEAIPSYQTTAQINND